MIKKISILAIGLFVTMSCSILQPNTSEVGANKDSHGCLISAGESWSILQGKCIQVFNVAQRLDPIKTVAGGQVISAFALLNDDKSKVELFLPEGGSVVLNKLKKNTFKSNIYEFDAKKSIISINGVKTYQAK